MGYSNFRRVFKEYTGFSPAKYIQEVRIGKIKEALTNLPLPVKQIAFEAGYDNEDYFFTAFRRVTGMTPLEYRNFKQGKKQS
jgi:AraC-like DNA-binding protein